MGVWASPEDMVSKKTLSAKKSCLEARFLSILAQIEWEKLLAQLESIIE